MPLKDVPKEDLNKALCMAVASNMGKEVAAKPLDVVTELLNNGAYIDSARSDGKTVLIYDCLFYF